MRGTPVMFAEELSPAVRDAYHLSRGEYEHFGAIFFHHPSRTFRNEDAGGMRSVHMLGLSKGKAPTMEAALENFPRKAVSLYDQFYGRDSQGDYFQVTVEEYKISAIKMSPRMVDTDMEQRVRLATMREVVQAAVGRRDVHDMRFLTEKLGRDTKQPLFSLDAESAEWLNEKPAVLREVGFFGERRRFAIADVPKFVNQWAPEHVEGFFRNPREYGFPLNDQQITILAMEMKPSLAPMIVRAGVLPEEKATHHHKNTPIFKAFREQEGKMIDALGGREEMEKLLALRRASMGTTPELLAMERRLQEKGRPTILGIPNRIQEIARDFVMPKSGDGQAVR